MKDRMAYQKVLDFWFKDNEKNWFAKNEDFDKSITEKFLTLHEELSHGRHKDWEESPDSLLAMVIVLDQFSRNMFRDTKKSFAFDHQALGLSKKAILKGYDKNYSQDERAFLYLPFEHSEELEDQKDSVKFFTKLFEDHPTKPIYLDFAIQHYKIIERFGRFPHRNKILERKSTPEELEFLKEAGSTF